MKKQVVFARCAGYDPAILRPALEEVFAPQLADFGSIYGKSVMLKPNLLAWKRENDPTCVNGAVIVETAKLFLDAGAAKVSVLENPAIRDAGAILESMGVAGELKKLNVEYANFSDYRLCDLEERSVFKSAELAREYLDFDCVADLAKVKTHGMMTLTLAVKNLFGFISGSERLAWHLKVRKNFPLFADFLLDLYLNIAPQFNLLDGIVAMEGNGPGSGTPVNCSFLAGCSDALALDAAAAPLLGVNDLLIVRRAEERNILPEYEITGAIPALAPLKLPDPPSPVSQWGLPLPTGLRETMREKLLAKPALDKNKCVGCGICAKMCPPQSLKMKNGKPVFSLKECIRCCCCQEHCPQGAIEFRNNILLKGIERFRSILSKLAR